jgi:hypothetical protein
MRRIFGMVGLAAAATFVGVDSAGGAFPGVNGRIVFARGSILETVTPDGTGLTPLLASGAHPAWSPDGRASPSRAVAGSSSWTQTAPARGR